MAPLTVRLLEGDGLIHPGKSGWFGRAVDAIPGQDHTTIPIRVGDGSGELNGWSGYYMLNPWGNIRALYLDNLVNGGTKGDGAKVLQKAREYCREHGYALFLVVLEKQAGRLVNWYLRQGMQQLNDEWFYAPDTVHGSEAAELEKGVRFHNLVRTLHAEVNEINPGPPSCVSFFGREKAWFLIKACCYDEVKALIAKHGGKITNEHSSDTLVGDRPPYKRVPKEWSIYAEFPDV